MKMLWVDNRLTTACEKGFTLIYDEFNRSRDRRRTTSCSASWPKRSSICRSCASGEGYVDVHPDFRAIFTSNPEEYAGTHKTQDALMDRLITLHLNHYDRQTEILITSEVRHPRRTRRPSWTWSASAQRRREPPSPDDPCLHHDCPDAGPSRRTRPARGSHLPPNLPRVLHTDTAKVTRSRPIAHPGGGGSGSSRRRAARAPTLVRFSSAKRRDGTAADAATAAGRANGEGLRQGAAR